MTENGPEAAPGSDNGPEGVFGNLPSKRPGSRSPRRRGNESEKDASEAGQEVPEPVAAESAKAAEPEPVADPIPEPEPPQPREDPLAPQPGIHGVEDLAWAGVAVVAQAATAGI